MIKKYWIPIILFLLAFQSNTQSINKSQLYSKSYDTLTEMYGINVSDTAYAKQIANAYLKKAKDEDKQGGNK